MGPVAASTPMGLAKGLNEIITRNTLTTAPGRGKALYQGLLLWP